MSATQTQETPALIGTEPPPLRRDPMLACWLTAVFVTWLGDYAWTVALAWTAAHTLSPGVAGLVIGAEMLPQAVLVLLGGVLADRFDPRRTLVFGAFGSALVLALGALAWSQGLHGAPVLFTIALLFGVEAGLTLPSGSTLMRSLVRPDDLGTVNGWFQVGGRVAKLLGAPAGGILVAWGGPVPVMLADTVTFLVVGTAYAVVVRPRYRLPRVDHERWRDSLLDGLAYLRRERTARLLIIGLTALNVFVSPVTALGLALRVSDSGWGAGWVGVADAALAAGAIVGSLAGMRWQPSAGARAGFWALVAQGVGLAAVGVGWRPSVVAGMALVGVTAGLASVWLSGAFLRTIAASHLGRVSSVSSLGDMTLMPLSVPVLGVVAGASSVLVATVAFGLSMSLLCLWFATRPVFATV